jgi:transposase
VARQIAVEKDVAGSRMDTEEGELGAGGLNGYQRGPGRLPIFLSQDVGELLNRRRLEERNQRQLLAGHLFDLCKKAHGEQ